MKITCEFCGHAIDVKKYGSCPHCGAAYNNNPAFKEIQKAKLNHLKQKSKKSNHTYSIHTHSRHTYSINLSPDSSSVMKDLSPVKDVAGLLIKGMLLKAIISVVVSFVVIAVICCIFLFTYMNEVKLENNTPPMPTEITDINTWVHDDNYALEINSFEIQENTNLLSIEYSIRNTGNYTQVIRNLKCFINGIEVELSKTYNHYNTSIDPNRIFSTYSYFKLPDGEINTISFVYGNIHLRVK